MSPEEIFNDRKNKFLRIGRSKGFMNNLDGFKQFKNKQNKFKKKFINLKNLLFLIVGLILLLLFFNNIFYKAPQHFLNFLPVATKIKDHFLTFFF